MNVTKKDLVIHCATIIGVKSFEKKNIIDEGCADASLKTEWSGDPYDMRCNVSGFASSLSRDLFVNAMNNGGLS